MCRSISARCARIQFRHRNAACGRKASLSPHRALLPHLSTGFASIKSVDAPIATSPYRSAFLSLGRCRARQIFHLNLAKFLWQHGKDLIELAAWSARMVASSGCRTHLYVAVCTLKPPRWRKPLAPSAGETNGVSGCSERVMDVRKCLNPIKFFACVLSWSALDSADLPSTAKCMTALFQTRFESASTAAAGANPRSIAGWPILYRTQMKALATCPRAVVRPPRRRLLA